MYKAKALTGECAGEPIKADKPGLTHRICREWKFYCPECYQFVHWSKSESEDKNSYFAHYDVEDKSCDFRVKSSSNNAAVNINNNDNQGQDLEGIQKDFEAILSRIDIFYKEIVRTINNISCLKYISNEIKNKFIKLDANKNINEEWKELEDWILNNSYNDPDHCIAILNILSIDMNKHILDKHIQYAICRVIFERFDLSPIRAKESTIKAQIQSNKEDFFNKTIEKTLQIILDLDWRYGKQFKTNPKKKKYQPYVPKVNRGDDNSSLFLNERYSIIRCERLIYSVIDKTTKNSELKLELNYEKGVNCKFLLLTSQSQDFFSQLIWKIINSGNVQWFMLAVGILASQKQKKNRNKVNFPEIPLFASKKLKDIIVTIKPSNINENILAYIEWCDLSIITPGKSAIWHPYGSVKRKKVKDVAVLYFHVPDKVPNKFYNYAANYKLQDGKHTAIHYVAIALTQWGLRDNDYVVNPIKPQYQSKQLDPRPLYDKELSPKEIDGRFYIRLVKDNRECKAVNDFKRKNPHLKKVAHDVKVRTILKAVKDSTLSKLHNTEQTASSSKEISKAEFDRLLSND